MTRTWLLALLVLALVASSCQSATDGGPSTEVLHFLPPGAISASAAAGQIGSRATVCDDVESTNYARGSRGQPTFLNLARPFPNQIFTIVIWGDDRGNFPTSPESFYSDETVCVTGLVEVFRGVPQIVPSSSSQLSIVD